MKSLKVGIKKIQAIDDNFLPKLNKFPTFTRLLDSLAQMFLIPTNKLNSSYSISDFRWKEYITKLKPYIEFYQDQFRFNSDKLPKIYKINIEQRIIQDRCYCLDITKTIHYDGQLVLWKCNNCRRYLSYLNCQISDPLKAYQLL